MADDLHHQAERRERWEEAYREGRRSMSLRRWRIRRLLDVDRDSLIVEVGCGDGLNLEVLRGIGYRRVLGLEYSPALLAGLPQGRLVAGDATALPLADCSADALFFDSVLHHLTDYLAAARETARVLRPGGRVFCFEPRASGFRDLLDRVTRSPLAPWVPGLRGRPRTLAEEWELYSAWLVEEPRMGRHFEAAGLRRRYRKTGPISVFLSYEKPASGAA